MARDTVSRVPLSQLQATLRNYSAQRHRDVSTDKGHVYFSKPLQRWILVQSQNGQAVLTFSDECPCKNMGVKY